MRKDWLAHAAGLSAGLFVAVATMVLSYYKLKQPQIPLDWAALVFSGLTTGVIAYMVVWGHFQDNRDVIAVGDTVIPAEEDILCPRCGKPAPKYHPIWTIVIAIAFFPIGLVVLFMPWRRCIPCNHTFRPQLRPANIPTRA